MKKNTEKKKRRFPFLIVLLSILLAAEMAGLVYVLLPAIPHNAVDLNAPVPLQLMRPEAPDSAVIELTAEGFTMGDEAGSYTYDGVTGTYTLDSGATLRMLPDRYELRENGETTVLATAEMLKTPKWVLYGSDRVKVPGGYTMDIDFTLGLYEDGTCRLSNSLSETVFDGTWSKNADGSLNVSVGRMKMLESMPGKVTLSGNIGLKVTVTLEGEVG